MEVLASITFEAAELTSILAACCLLATEEDEEVTSEAVEAEWAEVAAAAAIEAKSTVVSALVTIVPKGRAAVIPEGRATYVDVVGVTVASPLALEVTLTTMAFVSSLVLLLFPFPATDDVVSKSSTSFRSSSSKSSSSSSSSTNFGNSKLNSDTGTEYPSLYKKEEGK